MIDRAYFGKAKARPELPLQMDKTFTDLDQGVLKVYLGYIQKICVILSIQYEASSAQVSA